MPDPLNQASLLLAGHGSSRPGAVNPVHFHAEAVKAGGRFAAVFEGYLKQSPLLGEVLGDISTDRLYVVPMLTGHGYITDQLIPGALAELPAATEVRMCEPIGCHPAMAEMMAARIETVIADNRLDRSAVSVMLAAHGNRNDRQNADQAEALARAIAGACAGVAVAAAFIEEAPLISDWPGTAKTDHLIVLPFLIGGGLHGAVDVPEMLGLDPADPALLALGAEIATAGPFSVHGRAIWYCRAFGHDPALSRMILDLVEASP